MERERERGKRRERQRERERGNLHIPPCNLIISIFLSNGIERLLIKSAGGTVLGRLTR